jgi:NAD(P)-dependent dehydrogenase (short-subunit alcohol dehydrogenase family)
VAITDKDEARLQNAVSEGRLPRSEHCLLSGLDVTDAASLDRVLDECESRFQSVDLLVNNAGVYTDRPIDVISASDFRVMLEINAVGSALCSLGVARRLVGASKPGCIVNIASVDGIRPSGEGLSHYTTSKHAVVGLTRALAMELGPKGIRVNAICPGVTRTEGLESFFSSYDSTERVAKELETVRLRTPLRRLCEPDDIARATVALASDLFAFANGVVLPIDGGYLVQPLQGYLATE